MLNREYDFIYNGKVHEHKEAVKPPSWTDIQVFNPYDNRIAILSNGGDDACPFWDAMFKEELNKASDFEFSIPASHPDAQYIVAENQIVFSDRDNNFRLFVIRETEDTDGENGPETNVYCLPAMLELSDEIVINEHPNDATAEVALTNVLKNTRWNVGAVAGLGKYSTDFYYINVIKAINKIIELWGGELQDRVTFDENGITGRFIDLLPRRGADDGYRWEIDHNIISIQRTIKSYPKTALYGTGQTIRTDDSETKNKLTFADIEWSKANGDPVDKPKGQTWVGSPSALQTFGHKNPDGTLRHRFGVFEDGDQKDAETLLQETWQALQRQKKQLENFKMDVFLLEELSGMDHTKVRLGDTTYAIDRSFANPIETEARVISFTYSISDPENTGEVELGDFIDLHENAKRIDEIQSKIEDKSGIWETTTDQSFPDKVPPVPANFTATGLFKTIQVDWKYDPSSFIASYELYASQIKGFAPDSSNLIWKGKSGGYAFGAQPNQQWYFRIRAVNTHGTPSAYSTEIQANTQKIMTDDMLFGSVNSDILAKLAVEAKHLADDSVEERAIAKLAVGNAAIQNLAVTNEKIGKEAVGYAQIAKAVITDDLIAPNAEIDFAKIANVNITNAMIANAGIDFAKIYDVVITNAMINSVDAGKLQANTVIAGDITFKGTLSGADGTFTGTLKGVDGDFSGSLSAASGTFRGSMTAGNITGSTITGSTIQTNGSSYGDIEIQNGYLKSTQYGDQTIIGGGWVETRENQSTTPKTVIQPSGVYLSYDDGSGSTSIGHFGWSGNKNSALYVDDLEVQAQANIHGDFYVSGSKSALVKTKNFGNRLMYAVESPDNRFMDVIEQKLESGKHWIHLNPMFAETINGYSVFPIPQNGGHADVLQIEDTRFQIEVFGDTSVKIACWVYGRRIKYEDEYMKEIVNE